MLRANNYRSPLNRLSHSLYAVVWLLIGSFSTLGHAQTTGDVWAPPTASATSLTNIGSPQFASYAGEMQLLRDGQQSSVQLTQSLTHNNALAVRYSQALKQRDLTLGWHVKNLSLSYMSGAGEDYNELGGEYAGIDPYLFHGGWDTEFRYSGFAMDYRLAGNQHVQYGEATVRAAGLLDRTAQYLEWSNPSLYARATQFSRGSENIGNGFDAGFAFAPNKSIALQTTFLDQGRSMQRVRLRFDGRASRQYWLDVSAHQNDLYRDSEDVRVMFTFKTLLGTKSLTSWLDEAESTGTAGDEVDPDPEADPTTAKKPGKGKGILVRGLLIGVGVAAAAGGSSSGSSMADAVTRFRTQHEAALAVLNGINPTSIRENREYGGWVFANPDGSFGSSTPKQGEAASVQLPARNLVVPIGSVATASYHTHAGFDRRFDNENFSPRDLDNDVESGTDGYLATPGGQFKFHDHLTGQIFVLGTVATGG